MLRATIPSSNERTASSFLIGANTEPTPFETHYTIDSKGAGDDEIVVGKNGLCSF